MLRLCLKLSEYEKIHAIADCTRSRVSIDRNTLEKLLTDHGAILGALTDNNIDYQEPHDPVYDKPRPKLKIKKRK